MTIPTTVFDSADELGSELAREIADSIAEADIAGRRYVLGCPGGRTPGPVYRALAREVSRRALPLSHVIVAMMDDYVELGANGEYANVDGNAHYSCRRFGREEIYGTLNAASGSSPIPDSNLWVPSAASPEEFDGRLREVGGIDLFLLASGASDGHVAFNPPGSLRQSTTRIVQLARSTQQDNLLTFPNFTGIDEVPNYGVTVGIETISAMSKSKVMILTGRDKYRSFQVLSAAVDYNPDWPATVVATGSDSRLYVDKAAAGRERQTK